MKFKIPNYLTIGRIIIVPIFVVTFYLPGFYGDLIPFLLFIIAAITSQFFIVPSITNKIKAVATIILSAIGSNSSPSLDSYLYILANNPSKKSVKDAITNNAKGITSPQNPGR